MHVMQRLAAQIGSAISRPAAGSSKTLGLKFASGFNGIQPVPTRWPGEHRRRKSMTPRLDEQVCFDLGFANAVVADRPARLIFGERCLSSAKKKICRYAASFTSPYS